MTSWKELRTLFISISLIRISCSLIDGQVRVNANHVTAYIYTTDSFAVLFRNTSLIILRFLRRGFKLNDSIFLMNRRTNPYSVVILANYRNNIDWSTISEHPTLNDKRPLAKLCVALLSKVICAMCRLYPQQRDPRPNPNIQAHI